MANEPSAAWDKSAEILAQTSKAFLMFETAMTVARTRLEGAAQAERLAAAAQRAEADARQGVTTAQQETAAILSRAQADAAQITAGAQAEREHMRAEVALLASDRDALAGELADLKGQKEQLAADVQQLVGAKAAMQPSGKRAGVGA